MPQRIGFIGIGKMGRPMSTRLVEAGFSVTVWNRTTSKAEEVAKRGAQLASSPRELAAASEVIITMITDGAALEAVTLGDNGALAGLNKGSILIDMSTLEAEASQRVATLTEERGATMLRAPVSGSVSAAEGGTLTILASGNKDAYESCKDIFSVFGPKMYYVGGTEEARYLKLVINSMIAVSNHMLAEALVLGEKAGLNWDIMCELLNNSWVTSPIVSFKISVLTAMLAKGEAKVGAVAAMMNKDLDLILGLAKKVGAPMPVTAVVRQFTGMLPPTGKGEIDYSAVFFLLEELAGIKRDIRS